MKHQRSFAARVACLQISGNGPRFSIQICIRECVLRLLITQEPQDEPVRKSICLDAKQVEKVR